MPKGYWIAHVHVHDGERYKSYLAEAAPAYKEHGVKFIVRGGKYEDVWGSGLGERHVVFEFETIEKARACWNSPVYQKAKLHREAAATGNIIIVEGAA